MEFRRVPGAILGRRGADSVATEVEAAAHGTGPAVVPSGPGTSAPAARTRVQSFLVVAGYVLVGCAAYWPLSPDLSRNLLSVETDYTQSVWFIAWVPHALAHGLNPFFTHAMFVPVGVNLAQNTASPLLGLLTTPLTLVMGPVAITNLLMVAAMPLSATAAFWVLRRWEVWLPAAAVGGLMYGFSPYMVGQATGHVELAFAPFPPLIAWAVVRLVRRQGGPVGLGVTLGLLVAAQYLVSPEVLACTALFAVAGVLLVLVRRRARARDLAAPVAVALLVAGVVLAYPLWMLLAGPQHFHGHTWSLRNPFHNDVLSFVVPGPLQRTALGLRGTGTHLSSRAGPTEAGGYIGIPVLLVAGFLAWRSRRSPRTQLVLALLVLAVLLSLGPHLSVNGTTGAIPLPFAVLDQLPLLNDILPARINLEVGALVGCVVAFGLDDLHRAAVNRLSGTDGSRSKRIRPLVAVVAVVAVLAVVVVTQLPRWPSTTPYTAVPAASLPAGVRSVVPAGGPVAITFPYASNYDTSGMLWQVQDAFRFQLLGGYAYRPGPGGLPTLAPPVMHPPELQQFLAAQGGAPVHGTPLPLGPELVASTRRAIAANDIRLVVVDVASSGSGPVVALFDDALGAPRVTEGRFVVWTPGVGG